MKKLIRLLLLLIAIQIYGQGNYTINYEKKIYGTCTATKDTLDLSSYEAFKFSLAVDSTILYRLVGQTDSTYFYSTEVINFPSGNGWYDGTIFTKLIIWAKTSGTINFRLWSYGRKAR